MTNTKKIQTGKPVEAQLRPQSLSDYIGQKKVTQALKLFVDAVVGRGSVAEHVLLYGPPGIGKTTLANIVANELHGELKVTSGPAIAKTGDLAAILTNLKDNDVLFIDEIHRLPKPVEEALYPVMEDFFLDIVIGKGPAARTVRLPVPRITIIGATTRMALLSAPLRDRFGLVLRLDYYEDNEMTDIIMRSSTILDLPITKKVAESIGNRSRKTPRLANRILKRVRDLYEVNKIKTITEDTMDELFSILQIDEVGLSDIDMKYLITLITKFEGGPAGVNTMSSSLTEDTRSIEEYIEPYLLRLGFIKKTPQGRVATSKAYKHLKINKKMTSVEQERLV